MFKKNPQPQSSPALEEPASSTELVSRRAKLEDERMSRRQALRKMGILSGVAVLSLISIDDLARLATQRLADSNAQSNIARSLAKDFRDAGVAFADTHDVTPSMLAACNASCDSQEASYWATLLTKIGKTQDDIKKITDGCKTKPTQNDQDKCFIAGAKTLVNPEDPANEDYLDAINGFAVCCHDNCTGANPNGDPNGCNLDPNTLSAPPASTSPQNPGKMPDLPPAPDPQQPYEPPFQNPHQIPPATPPVAVPIPV